jgi:hypothetical protein
MQPPVNCPRCLQPLPATSSGPNAATCICPQCGAVTAGAANLSSTAEAPWWVTSAAPAEAPWWATPAVPAEPPWFVSAAAAPPSPTAANVPPAPRAPRRRSVAFAWLVAASLLVTGMGVGLVVIRDLADDGPAQTALAQASSAKPAAPTKAAEGPAADTPAAAAPAFSPSQPQPQRAPTRKQRQPVEEGPPQILPKGPRLESSAPAAAQEQRAQEFERLPAPQEIRQVAKKAPRPKQAPAQVVVVPMLGGPAGVGFGMAGTLSPVEQMEVNKAIDRGIAYLQQTQLDNGSW